MGRREAWTKPEKLGLNWSVLQNSLDPGELRHTFTEPVTQRAEDNKEEEEENDEEDEEKDTTF